MENFCFHLTLDNVDVQQADIQTISLAKSKSKSAKNEQRTRKHSIAAEVN